MRCTSSWALLFTATRPFRLSQCGYPMRQRRCRHRRSPPSLLLLLLPATSAVYTEALDWRNPHSIVDRRGRFCDIAAGVVNGTVPVVDALRGRHINAVAIRYSPP